MPTSESDATKLKPTIIIALTSQRPLELEGFDDKNKSNGLCKLTKCSTTKRERLTLLNDHADSQILKQRQLLPKKPPSVDASNENKNIIISDSQGDVVYLPSIFSNILKDHQLRGLEFLWRNVVQESSGAVLAHAMGLGKTVQVISFLYTLYCAKASQVSDQLRKGSSLTVLILCPPIVIDNWKNEFLKWIPFDLLRRTIPGIYKLKDCDGIPSKHALLEKWHSTGGVMLCGYQMFRDLAYHEDFNTDISGQQSNLLAQRIAMSQRYLCNPGPDLVVCDESHTIKNEKSSLNKAVHLIRTPLRVCLTGYPLQNNLKEYWCMINFCRPNYLPNWEQFHGRFVYWIVRGLYRDASDSDRSYAKHKLYVLTVWLESIVYRLNSDVLHHSLPPKREYHIQCLLTPLQKVLYERFLNTTCKGLKRLFAATMMLTRIVNHPATLKIAKDSGRVDDLDEDATLDSEEVYRNFKWAEPELQLPSLMSLELSGKAMIALRIIELALLCGEKVLLFSRSICTLDYLGMLLTSYGVRFHRIDGSVHNKKRQPMIDSFQPTTNVHVFLLSSLAGSLGVNLTAASRVILFDVGWNPCHDEQAIGRAFRFGQTKPVFVYRLCSFGTIESRIHNLNTFKVILSCQAVDKKEMEKLVRKGDLRDYFKPPQDPPPPTDHTFVKLPDNQDYILNQLLKTHSSNIVRVIDHQKTLDDFSILDLPTDQKAEAMKELDFEKKRQELAKTGQSIQLEPINAKPTTTMPGSYSSIGKNDFLSTLCFEQKQCNFESSSDDEFELLKSSQGRSRYYPQEQSFDFLRQSQADSILNNTASPPLTNQPHVKYRGSGFKHDPIIISSDVEQ